MPPKVLQLSFLGLFFCFSWRFYDRFYRSDLRITFFDVGQGDSALLEFPQGKTLLVDAGGGNENWDWGKQELLGELTRKSILTLDAALMTHPDRDHSYGFRGLFSELGIGEFWINSSFLKDGLSIVKELSLAAELAGGKVVPFSKNQTFFWNGVQIELIPLQTDTSTNNRSLILKVRFGKCSGVLTGDIEKNAEAFLAPLVGENTFLKVAHHGSKTSSTLPFLSAVKPLLAVISDGRKNSYGHPHRHTVERFRREGIEVLRTDFHGFIELTLTPNQIRCRSARGFCGDYLCP